MINYEYEWHTIPYEYTTNIYGSWVTRYNTITIYFYQNRIVIVLGQPYKGHQNRNLTDFEKAFRGYEDTMFFLSRLSYC
jgi:hypothetical protein